MTTLLQSRTPVPRRTSWRIEPTDLDLAVAATREAGAAGHWLFGSDNAAREDLVSKQVLTGSGASYGTGTMTISSRYESPIEQKPNQTIAAVFKKFDPTAGLNAIVGTWPASGNAYGNLFYTDTTQYGVSTKGIDGAAGPERGIPIPGTIGTDNIFVGIATGPDGRDVFVGGGDNYYSLGAAVAAAGHTIGLGGIGGFGTKAGMVLMELIIWDYTLTADEMASVFLRSGDRVFRRGNSLYGT